MPGDVFTEFTDFAHQLADAAGPIARRYYRTPVTVDAKDDASPVTRADREIETALRRLIEERYPDHGILGEEHGSVRLDAEYVWVVDPIDGTKAFITGKPSFGTLVGLTRRGRPVLGVIDQPITAERWTGAAGAAALNGQAARTRACPTLVDAILYATTPDMFTAANGARGPFDRLQGRVRHALYGADCYAYGLLASGFVDLVCEAELQPYDYIAVTAVVEAAGGVVTNWRGEPANLTSGERILAAGDPALHAAALAVLNDG